MADVLVIFQTDSGGCTVTQATTNADGLAKATLSSPERSDQSTHHGDGHCRHGNGTGERRCHGYAAHGAGPARPWCWGSERRFTLTPGEFRRAPALPDERSRSASARSNTLSAASRYDGWQRPWPWSPMTGTDSGRRYPHRCPRSASPRRRRSRSATTALHSPPPPRTRRSIWTIRQRRHRDRDASSGSDGH